MIKWLLVKLVSMLAWEMGWGCPGRPRINGFHRVRKFWSTTSDEILEKRFEYLGGRLLFTMLYCWLTTLREPLL